MLFSKKGWRDLISRIFGVGCAILIGLPVLVLAVPTLTIDSPDDGATIESDNTIVSGIASAVGEGQGIDLMLVLDDSGSLGGTDPTKERFEAVRQLLNGFGPNADVQVGAVFFSNSASLAVGLQSVGNVTSAINQAIANHQIPYGGTAIGDGIAMAADELIANARPAASHVILVFTDGMNNDGIDPIHAASNAKLEGYVVHVIGLLGADQVVAESIAVAGGGKLFFANNPTELLALFKGSEIVDIESVTVTNVTTGMPAGNVNLVMGSYTAPVDLVEGDNVLEVIATDTYGEVATASVTVTVPVIVIINPCDDNPYGDGCPVYRSVKLRPQVLMAGFDPMLVDIVDDSFKVVALVREGAAPILHVTVSENTGGFSTAMKLEGQLSNGDKIYSLTFAGMRGVLYGLELPNLFGSGIGEYNITVIDQAQQTHSFPDLEFGNNVNLQAMTPLTQSQPYTTVGIRRLKPQPIMVGFDPALIDYDDSAFKVKAIVRRGLANVRNVTLKNGGGMFAIAMDKEEDLPNGDEMYSLVYTFPRGAFDDGALRDLFGSDHPEGEFMVEVIDEAQQRHAFPVLEGGNFPAQ